MRTISRWPCVTRRRISPSTASALRARGAAHERNHAEGTRERAAVLDLHEGANAVELRVGLDAADRADVAGDGLDRLLDLARHDATFVGSPANACRRASRRSRSRTRGRAYAPPARRPGATCASASFVTQQVFTTATSPLPSTRGDRRGAAARATPARRSARPCSRGNGPRSSPSARESTRACADRPPSHSACRAARSCIPRAAGRLATR